MASRNLYLITPSRGWRRQGSITVVHIRLCHFQPVHWWCLGCQWLIPNAHTHFCLSGCISGYPSWRNCQQLSHNSLPWQQSRSCCRSEEWIPWCGRGSCYGVELNGYFLEHSRSKDRFQWDVSTSRVFLNHKQLVVCDWRRPSTTLTNTLEVETSHWNLSLLHECLRKYPFWIPWIITALATPARTERPAQAWRERNSKHRPPQAHGFTLHAGDLLSQLPSHHTVPASRRRSYTVAGFATGTNGSWLKLYERA